MTQFQPDRLPISADACRACAPCDGRRRCRVGGDQLCPALPMPTHGRPGAYDGIWNVVFATTRGNCSSGYSVPFTVVGQPRFVGRRRQGLGLASTAPARLRSEFRSAHPRRAAAAGSPAVTARAAGAASSPATAAAAPGRRRGTDLSQPYGKRKTARQEI